MRILHVMDHSLPKSDGYAVRAKYLLEAQAAAGHEVVVLTGPAQGGDAEDEDIAGVRYRRCRYQAWESGLVARGAKHLVFGAALSRGLARTLSGGAFDLVHGHTPFTVSRIALRAARRNRLPFVYEKRNLWEESARARGKPSGRWPFYQLARSMDRRVTRHADAVCTITHALKRHAVGLGARADGVFVVGNGVDTDAFAPRAAPPALRERCLAGGELAIGFVGSFFSFEGLPLLVEAFAALRAKHPRARLVLVGDGEDAHALERLVRERSLGDSVWLAGRVPHASVADFYAAMDVLVYPRYASALTQMISPLKPLEAMAMARCVVASDVGGLSELVRDGETGLLFRAGSSAELQARLAALLDAGPARAAALGERARRHVVACRQWRQMAAAYGPAYERARHLIAVKNAPA